MPQELLSAVVSYCSPAELFQFHDWQQVADLVRDGDGPRPSRAMLLDTGSAAGQIVQQALLAASGELESACLAGNRYRPGDLVALTGGTTASAVRLKKLVADLAYWSLMQRRQPASADPKNCPGAQQAIDTLQQLREGQRVFGFAETGDAGLASTVAPDVSARPKAIEIQAYRFFGDHANRQ